MPNRPKITDLDEFARLYRGGEPVAKLAERYGCNEATVLRTRDRLGLGLRRPPLDDERRAKIEAALADGWSHAEIARTVGVDVETLARHYPGTQWRKEQVVRHAIDSSYYARKKGLRLPSYARVA